MSNIKLQYSNQVQLENEDNEYEDIINYKGVFFNDETEKRYYEAGAHFRYQDLYKRLLKLQRDLSASILQIERREDKKEENVKIKEVDTQKEKTKKRSSKKFSSMSNLSELQNNEVNNNKERLKEPKFIKNANSDLNLDRENHSRNFKTSIFINNNRFN